MPQRLRAVHWPELLVLVAAAAWSWPQLRLGLNLDDEGLLCDYAERLLRGQTPYVDFLPPYALGRYLGLALFFRVFGVSVVTERALCFLILAVAAWLTVRVARRVLPTGLVWLPALLLLAVPGPHWKSDLPFGLSLGVLLALRYGERPSRLTAAVCGAGLGALAWLRPDLPVFGAVVLLTVRFVSPEARARPFSPDALVCAAAAVATVLPLGAWIALSPGALRGFWEAHVWMTELADKTGLPLVAPWNSTLGLANGLLAFAGPLLALAAAITLAIRARKRPLEAADVALAALAIVALFSWNQVRLRANFSHVRQASWAVWVLGPALLWRWTAAEPPKRLRNLGAGVAVLLPFAFIAWQATLAVPLIPGLRALAAGRAVRTGFPKGDLWMPPRQAAALNEAVAELRARGGPALAAPYAPMLTFLADVPAASPLVNLIPGRLSDAGQERLARELERAGLKTLVVDPLPYPGELVDFESSMPVLWRELDRRFVLRARKGGYLFYERK